MSVTQGSSSAIDSAPPKSSSCSDVPMVEINGGAGDVGVMACSVSSELLRVRTTIDEGRLERSSCAALS